ncbi:MAG: hypothetical protein JNL05_02100 [Flavobacteriales bacterium]|nr:hypothetical protein [Flavobacteriales bacterium]
MIKVAALFNLFGLLVFNALFLADITITQDIPATMQAGSEVKVTVTVDKGDLGGFAKLQIDLPEGMTATAIETKGASFTFAEGKAKFIWMALPAQPSFKVTYTLAVAPNANGSLPVTGKFSFIEDNERKTKDLPVTSVTIIPNAVAQSATEPEPAAAAAASTTEEAANDVVFAGGAAPVKSVTVENRSGIAPQQGKGNVGATRTITPITADEMLVEVIVRKGDIRGFGKLQETIPTGFTALEKSSDEAIFTAQDRIVKFVWLNLPARQELKVTYKLRANGQPEGEYTVNGEFGYLLNDETQKAIVGSTTFPIGPKALELIAAATPEPTKELRTATGSEQAAQPETAQHTEAQQPTQTAQEPVAAAPVTRPTPSRIPSPETGVTYKVQITAAHREVGSAYFQQRHRYSGDFGIERHEGWIKYTTGRFNAYTEARDKRQAFISAGHDFPGPFVTAYNNGERITVQEALMLSNQKWVQ